MLRPADARLRAQSAPLQPAIFVIPSASSPWRTRLLLLAGIVAAFLAVRAQAKGNTDFDIYLTAAQEMVDGGGANLFRPHEDTGAYPYPHVFLLPLVALDAVLPTSWLRVLWALGLAACFVLICRDLDRISRSVRSARSAIWLLWIVYFALFARFFSTNFTHNQLSLWIGWFVLAGAVATAERRPLRGGLLLGTAAALKLTPILLLALLPFMARLRAAWVMAGSVLLLVFVVPVPFLGMAEHTRHLQQLYEAVVTRAVPHDGGGATAFTLGRSGSLYGTWHYVLQADVDDGVHFASLSPRTVEWILNGLRAALLALFAWGFLRAGRIGTIGDAPRASSSTAASDRWIAMHRLALGMLAMALFAPLTRTYHLAAAALPAWLFIWSAPGWPGRSWRRREHATHSTPTPWLWWATAACLAFAMTLRQKSLLGRELWLALDQIGMLHFGLLGMSLWLCWNGPVRDSAPVESTNQTPHLP